MSEFVGEGFFEIIERKTSEGEKHSNKHKRGRMKASIVTSSTSEILFLRKMDVFEIMSFESRSRVRSNLKRQRQVRFGTTKNRHNVKSSINKNHGQSGAIGLRDISTAEQWTNYKAELTRQMIQDKINRKRGGIPNFRQ